MTQAITDQKSQQQQQPKANIQVTPGPPLDKKVQFAVAEPPSASPEKKNTLRKIQANVVSKEPTDFKALTQNDNDGKEKRREVEVKMIHAAELNSLNSQLKKLPRSTTCTNDIKPNHGGCVAAQAEKVDGAFTKLDLSPECDTGAALSCIGPNMLLESLQAGVNVSRMDGKEIRIASATANDGGEQMCIICFPIRFCRSTPGGAGPNQRWSKIYIWQGRVHPDLADAWVIGRDLLRKWNWKIDSPNDVIVCNDETNKSLVASSARCRDDAHASLEPDATNSNYHGR